MMQLVSDKLIYDALCPYLQNKIFCDSFFFHIHIPKKKKKVPHKFRLGKCVGVNREFNLITGHPPSH